MSTDRYIIAHDMGTSADKAVLFNVFGEIVAQTQTSYPLNHPQPGFAEQNPFNWRQAIVQTTKELVQQAGVEPERIVGLTFSSQMQSLIPLSKEGLPLYPAVTWLDGRGAEVIRQYLWKWPRVQGYNIFNLLRFLIITGGSPGHSGKDQIGKLLWLKQKQPKIFEKSHKFVDAKDFIIFQLTGKLVTSVDLAVIWWLLDTRNNRNQWHPGLCRLAGISPEQLSEVKESAYVVGPLLPDVAEEMGLTSATQVVNGAGDLSSAALGSGALSEGELHISIGTSSWVAGHFTKRKVDLKHYTGCIGSAYPQKYYLAMAHQETAGLCLEWLRKNLFQKSETETPEQSASDFYSWLDKQAALAPPGSEGLLFLPWLYGERAPLNDDSVRGGFFNLSLRHQQPHLARAVLEGIALNTRWAMETLENLYQPVRALNMIGGGANSDLWCQIMADVTNREIRQVADPQLAGARGIALLASMALGYLPSFEAIKEYIPIKQTFAPNPQNLELYDRLFREFKNLYKQNKKWFKRMNRKDPSDSQILT